MSSYQMAGSFFVMLLTFHVTFVAGFVVVTPIQKPCSIMSPAPTVATPMPFNQRMHHENPRAARKITSLNALLDVPDGFFTVTFPTLGILLSLSKSFGRLRMEERAWEQRLEEARLQRLRDDPTLTELDLRRREAAMEWSAYGKPRFEEEEYKKQQREYFEGRQRGRRVAVMDREDEDDDDDFRKNRMTDEEIDQFELEYGVEYDPYYDDPYTEDELPEGKFDMDKIYGDRIYKNGEVFYKDNKSGLFYRQGSKPRNIQLW